MTERSHFDPTASDPLDRGAGLTAWRQIADRIEADIAGGLFKPGEKLPGEMQFAQRFGVNRHTVRRALAALAARGLVRATQGGGTFVEAKPLPYAIGRKTRFSELMAKAGREARGELIRSTETIATAEIAEALGLKPDAAVLEMVTLNRADEVPISMAWTWLPLPRFSGIDATYRKTGSLTRAFARHEVSDYSRLSTRISARIATVEEAACLELSPGRVLLVIDSINVNQYGHRIQATRSFFSADRVDLVIEQ
ncbi:GntR family phosphonate transport system transcriptional regulator [Microvirga flocculans]|uniref:GntR family phosphonate transport system transcriptional regulator n=1 Tax=Microvirga flocculans TaxID=217168 RepID=A0A7W6N617_9HYPH|nr:phosphonate metabolism transcriptional regulator PhnF [Microvirga flocculans]MBB4038473.1 GntR family phosphonate transport system transcriptional regulator [Microvirga flocculans]